MPSYDLVLRNGTVVNQDGVGPRDVAVRGGRIAEIGDVRGDAAETIDCTGLHILPGVIDSHVHFREPGAEHKENLETGSLAAVMGGVTGVFEMPNTSPMTVDAASLQDKLARASGRMHCDHAFYVGATTENASDLGELEMLPGCAGVKVFIGSSTGTLLIEDDEGIAEVMRSIRRRASFHAEDEPRLRERERLKVAGDPSSHAIWRDETAALMATERLIALARRFGRRIHILHVSTAEEVAYLADHKDIATAEATPHHLVFSSDDYAELGTKLQMNPPVRAARHRDAIWAGVASGVIDTIGSDHAPHALEEKAKPYPSSPSGMIGVQTLVPLLLDAVSAGRLTIERFVDLTSAGPARVYGIARKGRISAGYDADFTVVDLKRKETITNAWIASRCGWTPHDGRAVTGWPVGTFVRGQRVMWEGELVARGGGRPIEFLEALQRG
ncbi:dihydroorotase [Lutibaculum baratangense]|uniref:Dihydroorotase n=1 Tax=Lutibaculum baratangense AMV1 TaxID=631454 RepID=V4RF36_9HYPH|nr:dihydroorotase [Lutibaculum baratangense]ESR24761.1 Dihydroorotase [Lutibaculum baratangense AMV1]